MTMIVGAVLLVWLALVVARGTPVGRAMAQALVERPAARLARITAGHVLLTLMLGGAIALVIAVIGHEGARLLAMAAPEVAGWITMFEITAYLDALVAVATAASSLRLRTMREWLRPTAHRGRRPRTSRRARTVARRPAANDDGDGDGAALAA